MISTILLSGVLTLSAATADRSVPLMAAVARVDITPPLELHASLGGYGARMSKPAVGVHDRIWAKCLLLTQGPRRFAVVTADLLAIPPGFKQAVVAKLGATSLRDDQLILLASHSHTSLDLEELNPRNTFGIPQLGIFNRPVYERTVDLFAQVITQAAEQAPRPCTVGTADIRLSTWSHNRREGSTTIQPVLTVTRVDCGDGPLAVLVNWTAHPTFMDAVDMMFSGDWPGQMQRTLEALIGHDVTAMYYNGAEGDQSPTARPDSGDSNWEKAERYGRELAIRAWTVWRKVRPERDPLFAYHREPIALPQRTWHPDFMKSGGAEYGLSQSSVRTIVDTLAPTGSHSMSVRLGSLVIAGVPGEMIAALGHEVKQRIRSHLDARHVVIGGLADEWISYILTPAEYRKGGYEATMCFYGQDLGPLIADGVARGASTLTGVPVAR